MHCCAAQYRHLTILRSTSLVRRRLGIARLVGSRRNSRASPNYAKMLKILVFEYSEIFEIS